MVVDKIKQAVTDALKELGVKNPEVSLEHPAEMERGDYATSVALRYAKELKKPPKELAEVIVRYIVLQKIPHLARVEAVGGFVNFHFAPEFFAENIAEILEKKDGFGKSAHCAGMKTVVEFTDPNPFKEFHIGHLMSNAIGESIARIISFHGAEVKRACYQGDVGLHVAKAIWGMQKIKNQKSKIKIEEWGKAYTRGAEAYETDAAAKAETNDLNTAIFDRTDKSVNALYDAGKETSLAYFEDIYKILGTHFDYYFFESETGVLGKKLVEENLGRVFEQSDGAVVFPESKSGLHTRVFLNAKGLPTYEAKELGLARTKYEKYPYDFSVIITGNEVSEYFKVLLKAMALIFPDLAKKTKHLSHGMLRLSTGKMSSRTGSVVTAESLIDAVKEKVGTEEVAVGAIKYSILHASLGGDIIFDIDKSVSIHGDSGPYLQYSYARACSVLRKSPTQLRRGAEFARRGGGVLQLERLLYRFPEVVLRAGKEYAPHYIASYLIEIAGAFNSWYAKERILDAGEETPYRLALTEAFSIVMKNGLWLLGIAAPEKM